MKDTIRNGLKSGIVQLVVDPNMDHGTVCKIGDNWFYFGGLTAEEMNPDEYQRDIPEETIVKEIYDILEEFRTDPTFEDEYAYYDEMLSVVKKTTSIVLNLSEKDIERFDIPGINTKEELVQAIWACIDRVLPNPADAIPQNANTRKTLLCVNFFDEEVENVLCNQFLIQVKGEFDEDSVEDSFSSFAESEYSSLPYDCWIEMVLNEEGIDWEYIHSGQKIPACDEFIEICI